MRVERESCIVEEFGRPLPKCIAGEAENWASGSSREECGIFRVDC
jgi:hypothetical protein